MKYFAFLFFLIHNEKFYVYSRKPVLVWFVLEPFNCIANAQAPHIYHLVKGKFDDFKSKKRNIILLFGRSICLSVATLR